jgi:hypothetical protein
MRPQTLNLLVASKMMSKEAYKEALNLYFAANLMAYVKGNL